MSLKRLRNYFKTQIVDPINNRFLELTTDSNVPTETLKTFFTQNPDGTLVEVSTQSPLPVSDGQVCSNDIWVSFSNMNNFSGSPTDLFNNLHTVVSDTTANNPKELMVHFGGTIVTRLIGIGAFNGNGGEFSNVEIQIALSDGNFITVIDESADSTIKQTAQYLMPGNVGINAVKFIFHTTNTITISNLFIPTVKLTTTSLQALNPDNEIIDVGATLDGSLKVAVEDQHFRPITLRMNQVVQTGLTLAVDAVIDSRTITVSPGHGLVATDRIIILQENGEPQYFFTEIISVAVDVLTLDTLVPYVFLAAQAEITQYDPDLNKDGSVTTYKAELRNPFSFSLDITRFIFHMTDATAMDDSKFGGRAALVNGISLRKNIPGSGNFHFWNCKTNGEIGELSFDKAYDEKAPAGVYGFSSRLTYAGQSKHGVAILLEPGEAVEMLIQDDLTLLLSFTIMVEGHFNE